LTKEGESFQELVTFYQDKLLENIEKTLKVGKKEENSSHINHFVKLS